MALPKSISLAFDFYGAGNIGDDLSLDGFLRALKSIAIRDKFPLPAISCASPHNIASQRLRFPEIQWAQKPTGIESECWAGVGDTPLQVTSGDWSLDHLKREVPLHKDCPRRILVGIGAESEIEPRAAEFREVLKPFHRISARDRQSYRIIVERLGIDPCRVTLGADLAHLSLAEIFNTPANPTTPRAFKLGLIIAGDALAEADIAALSQFVTQFVERYADPIAFVACETRLEPIFERGIHQRLLAHLWPAVARRLHLCVPDYTTGDFPSLVRPIAQCETVLSARYHGLLAAAWAGCKIAAIGRSSKIAALAGDLKIPIAPLPIDPARLMRLTAEAVAVDRATLVEMKNRALAGVAFNFDME